MSDLERVVDKFSGFITKEQAEYILKRQSQRCLPSLLVMLEGLQILKELLKSLSPKNPQEKLAISDGTSSL